VNSLNNLTSSVVSLTGGSKSLVHTGWIGGREYLRRGKRIGYERFESVRGECERMSV
jgi:hypothetical protein